jgi:hypothetical protein
MGSSRVRPTGDVGCGRKAWRCTGQDTQRLNFRWVETWIIDPLCGAPTKRLTYSRPRCILILLSLAVLFAGCYVINVYLQMIYSPTATTPASKNKHLALPDQETPSATARSAMRLGFGCLMVLRLFGTGKPAALFDIHQSDIFPSAMSFAQ